MSILNNKMIDYFRKKLMEENKIPTQPTNTLAMMDPATTSMSDIVSLLMETRDTLTESVELLRFMEATQDRYKAVLTENVRFLALVGQQFPEGHEFRDVMVTHMQAMTEALVSMSEELAHYKSRKEEAQDE